MAEASTWKMFVVAPVAFKRGPTNLGASGLAVLFSGGWGQVELVQLRVDVQSSTKAWARCSPSA